MLGCKRGTKISNESILNLPNGRRLRKLFFLQLTNLNLKNDEFNSEIQ